jgi:HAD superfamily hydrolase (TIGR01490 family)
MNKVAFFDIDGTVFRSSLLIQLVEGLIKSGAFPSSVRKSYQVEYEAWQNRVGRYEDYIDAVVAAFRSNMKGLDYGAMADVGHEVVEKQRKKVYRYTRDLIADLKVDGYYIVAISQSPKTILDDFCREYGFDKVYGRFYEIGPQDKFTGVVVDEHLITNKANIVKRFLEHNPEFSLKDSVAVGDTESDIPLLEMVEHPICFNPNQVLYNQARLMKWEVVVERKDVIYHL